MTNALDRDARLSGAILKMGDALYGDLAEGDYFRFQTGPICVKGSGNWYREVREDGLSARFKTGARAAVFRMPAPEMTVAIPDETSSGPRM